MDIIQQVRDFVEEKCKKPTSHYGYEPFPGHFIPMADIVTRFADQLNADKEVVVIAALLHDIGSIIHGRKDHHITGAQIAEQKLREFGYPEDKIELIKKCIYNHRGSTWHERKTVEEQIIADADSICSFNMLTGLFAAALLHEKKSRLEAKKSVREKLERKWKQLHFEESKEIVRPKYEAAMLLLQ